MASSMRLENAHRDLSFILPHQVRTNEKYFPSNSDTARKTETKDNQSKYKLSSLFQVEQAPTENTLFQTIGYINTPKETKI